MAVIPVVEVNESGLDPDTPKLTAPDTSNTLVNDGRTLLVAWNTSGSQETVTVNPPGGTDVDLPGYTTVEIPALVVNVPATSEMWIQVPFRSYNAGSISTIELSDSAAFDLLGVKLATI